jgi:ribosomal protein S27AE
MQKKSLIAKCPACGVDTVVKTPGSYRAALKSYRDQDTECGKCGNLFVAKKESLRTGVIEGSERRRTERRSTDRRART